MKRKTHHTTIKKYLKTLPLFQEFGTGKEVGVFLFFIALFFIILVRLFSVAIIQKSQIEDQLNKQHTSVSLLKAKRGGIFVYDKSKNPINLTENVVLYNIFLDPKYIGEKNKVISILTPVLYKHLCEYYGLKRIDKLQCIKNIEIFSESKILPLEPEIAYLWSGVIQSDYHQFKDMTGYTTMLAETISGFTTEKAEYLIKKGLNEKIQIGTRKLNYLAFVTNDELIKTLENLNTNYIVIKDRNYIYINPHIMTQSQEKQAIKRVSSILMKYGYPDIIDKLPKAFKAQENRYVKIASNANSEVAHMMSALKEKHYHEKFYMPGEGEVPILHGLGLEENIRRYYPLGTFLANTLGYVDQQGNPLYGIEEYFDDQLRGIDGEIEGRSASIFWWVGANEFEVKNVQHGDNVYLTIDVGIQKKIEDIAREGQKRYRADAVTILVYNPVNGEIKATASYPTFNPNNYNDAYLLKTVDPELAYTLDDETQVDIPVYIKTWGQTRLAKPQERIDTNIKKYIPRNIYGASVFIDKNFSSPYEPGSIFKVLTTAIGLDTDEIDLYDLYTDPGEVKVGIYSIFNADKKNCKGEMPFLDALIYSCNIGMVRIAQKLNRNMFYNYLQKLGFGKKTAIEVADEHAGVMKTASRISKVGYFNNTFGQGILITPIQMVSALWTVVNGGHYVKPTLIKWRENPNTGIYTPNKPKIIKQIFRPETSRQIRNALFAAMEKNPDYVKYIRMEGKHLGGKSGTSEIAYRGVYRKGAGRTNGSYIWVDNTENPQYVVLVQVRRPRTSQWWVQTAGKIFRQVVEFVLAYTQNTEENLADNANFNN